ncbi:MAG TPA: Stk1 family PASTA domain-containing Ser/Thr kinase [Lachnospiraceae bacterium]|nr:Stk1 family PASTA domain-containing Ser/Thr kinase [Lachnospiraceae bacterium]
MLNPGLILDDRYEIVEVVGTGGMSTVYKAKDLRLQRAVALKVLKSEFSNDMNFVSKFRVEAQASAALSHPNIVNVYDVCEDDGKYFIVMELVEGITLKDYIRQRGRLDMNTAIDFSIQIASGLAAAHENHVIHRDIKPQNIIVGSNGSLKVTDFGIAKAATSNTMSTTNMGSVHYISPEQARGGYSDERSDIYSLGITMYEMVTGRVPFEGDTNVSIALMHIQNDIIPPTRLYPDIYSSLEKVIMKAVQKKPERRYLTANALIADLNRVKNNPNIDIIVAPSVVNNSPTREFTENDIQAIKRESSIKSIDTNMQYQNPAQGQYQGGHPAQTSVPQVNRSKLDQLMQEEDDSYYDVPETPVRKKGGIKKVDDDYDEYEEDPVYKEPERDDDDDDDGVDPKLEKVVMIAGIAAAVIIAVILFILIGNVLGWFKFGKGSDKKTTTQQPTTVTTTEENTNTTENTDDSSTTEDTTEATTASTEATKKKMIYVVGLSESAAKSQLEKAGFTNVRVDKVNDDEVPENYVIKQNISEAEEIELNKEIVITVSLGAAEISVPDVAGHSVEDADQILADAGFKTTHSYELSETIAKNNVIRTDPEAGSGAASGSTIKIIVSNGPKEVQVPDLRNLTEEAAVSNLESLKLAAGEVKREPSDTVPEGRVISQVVDSGASVPEGTPIGFTVSTGREVKTFSATISGQITPYDGGVVSNYIQESGGSIHIVIVFDDGKEKHTIADQDLNAAAFPFNVNQTYGGLEDNKGTVLIIINDTAGNEITSMFDTGSVKNVTYTTE